MECLHRTKFLDPDSNLIRDLENVAPYKCGKTLPDLPGLQHTITDPKRCIMVAYDIQRRSLNMITD